MIEYNCKQALTIVVSHADAVFWYAQLIISACEHAETILYSDQHTITLLRLSLSWWQHIFCCIFQSVAIRCQHFWHILIDFFFSDPAIMGHIIT